MPRIIRVFEHDTLKIGHEYKGVKFSKSNFSALAKYNDKHQSKFYTLVHEGIRFRQYVGVIQVGRITIEILPKIDSLHERKDTLWQSVLFQMLRECRYVKMDSFSEAHLKYRYNSLLDLYFEEYLKEINDLLRKGLVKRYRKLADNVSSLKGTIQFAQHLSKNLVHKERFYTVHSVYDYEHLMNQILLEGLHVLNSINNNPLLADKIKRTQFHFPDFRSTAVNSNSFDRIKYDRRTMRYKRAIEIAKMLILKYSPDITGGSNDLLALLFDMNRLWEEYIYRKIRSVEPLARRQNSQLFWVSNSTKKNIRPDIVEQRRNLVLDTKWKKLNRKKLDDGDLQQMYIYNKYNNCDQAYLLYPGFETKVVNSGAYAEGQSRSTLITVNPLLKSGSLNKDIGQELLSLF